jgi:antitoxin MazE
MKVAKWGNSLAVRLPAAIVETLGLKEGDDINLAMKGDRDFEVSRERSREEFLEEIRRLRVPMLPDYKFNREELYDRGDREPRYAQDCDASRDPGEAAD